MRKPYSFDDAQRGIVGTPVPVDLEDPTVKFWLAELGFSEPACEDEACTACISVEKLSGF